MRICIVTSGPLGSNPRVVKEATALQGAGYDVHVVCTKIPSHLEFCDQDILSSATWAAERLDISALLQRRLERARQCALRVAFHLTRLPALAESALSVHSRSLIAKAVSFPADLYIAHYPAALPAAAIAARHHGSLYAFDAEDFHLGEGPLGAEHVVERDIVRAIEDRYLKSCVYVTAASPGIANAYAEEYGIKRPTVLLNVFPRAQALSTPTPAGTVTPSPSVYWFSQTVGPDRGLQCAMRAIARARTRPHLYLRGSPMAGFLDRLSEIAAEAGVTDRLHLLPPGVPSEMARLASPFDLGLVGETGCTLNRRIALTNKQFTYLLAGLPIVMSDISAHRELASALGDAARLYSVDDPESLAAALDAFLGDRASLAAARNAAWRLGQERFNWDLEQINLLSCVRSATLGARQRRYWGSGLSSAEMGAIRKPQ
jgi:glycosyltransferase involved in cell wall biosynthesis